MAEWLLLSRFEILAGIAAALGQMHRAVRLLGVAAVLREQIGSRSIRLTDRIYDRDAGSRAGPAYS